MIVESCDPELQMSLRASFHSTSSTSNEGGGSHAASRSNSTKAPKSSSKEDYTFKLVMVGDSGVGKSCLLEKFLDLSSNNAFISTIGYEVRTHILKLDGQTVKMQVSLLSFESIFSCISTGSSIKVSDFSENPSNCEQRTMEGGRVMLRKVLYTFRLWKLETRLVAFFID